MLRTYYSHIRILVMRTSLVVQWLRLCTSTAGYAGFTPGRASSISYLGGQKIKKRIVIMMKKIIK